AILPAHLALFGAPGVIEIIGYAWFTVPLVLVWLISRSGDFERARLLSAVIFALMVGLIAAFTGGSRSFILPWLVVIPFEPALHASRRTALAAAAIAAMTALIVALLGIFDLLPAPAPIPVTFIDPLIFSTL